MKVIVKTSGWYGGEWFDGSKAEQEMPDAVAAQYLPPHGDQLALPVAPVSVKPNEPKPNNKAD